MAYIYNPLKNRTDHSAAKRGAAKPSETEKKAPPRNWLTWLLLALVVLLTTFFWGKTCMRKRMEAQNSAVIESVGTAASSAVGGETSEQ